MFDPDLFISWMAARGSGCLSALIRDAQWASGRERKPVTQWLGRIEALGVVSLDWRRRAWQANSCALTDLPGWAQTAILTGARPTDPDFYRGIGAVIMPQHPAAPEIPLPTAVWLQYDSPSHLQEFAARVDATVEPCAAVSATRTLTAFTPGPATAPPSRDSSVELLDPVTARFQQVTLGPLAEPGLYKYTVYGRLPRYALLREPRQAAPGQPRGPRSAADATWHSVDRRTGIHCALRPSAFPLKWQADTRQGQPRRRTTGRLTVHRRTPLPLAQERTAVLCTGLASLRTADHEHYDGVPLFIADRIARSLHRSLETS